MKPHAFRDNSLSVVFGALLVAGLGAQSVVGLAGYNDAARTDCLSEFTWWRYVTSSSFAVDVAENWQSEYLQFAVYILLTVWLVQRGSSESKPPGEQGLGSDAEEQVGPFARPDSPRPAKAGGLLAGIYSTSLTVVLATIFVLSWAAQAVAGRVAFNEERLRDRLDPLLLGQYVQSPDFWGRTIQNWQSEFLAVGSMAIFTVFLRQRGSPQSKPVGSPDSETPE